MNITIEGTCDICAYCKFDPEDEADTCYNKQSENYHTWVSGCKICEHFATNLVLKTVFGALNASERKSVAL
jgi:hypothetical protein